MKRRKNKKESGERPG